MIDYFWAHGYITEKSADFGFLGTKRADFGHVRNNKFILCIVVFIVIN